MRATAVTALLWVGGSALCASSKLKSNAPTSKIKTSVTREACATLCYTFKNVSPQAPLSTATNASSANTQAEFHRAVPAAHACLSAATKELPFCNTSLSIGARLDDLIGRLSLQEKAGLIGPDPVTSPCAFLNYGRQEVGKDIQHPRSDLLDIPPYLYLVETNTAVAFACIISQDMCATTFIGPTGLAAAFNRVISTEIRAFNNLNWHRSGGVLKKIVLAGAPFITGENAADVTGCHDGPDKKYEEKWQQRRCFICTLDGGRVIHTAVTAPSHLGLRHIDAYSVETSHMAFNGNISTFDLWDTETLNGGSDTELKETYCTTNGYLEQAVQHNRMTINTVNNAASMSARPADATLTSNNGRCISECPDGGHELGNACAEYHFTRAPSSCIAHCPLNYYAKDHRCVPCTTCGMGTWASTPCSASSDAVCSPWTECKPGQKESVSGNAYQPLPDRASCLPTSACEEPFIETIPPTLTTDCLCSCDTLTCNKLITQLFEEMVCADPTDEQLDVVLDVLLQPGEDGIRDTICQMDADEARRSCTGCTDTCECSAGFILVYDADSADCRPCDGVTEFSASIGGSKCGPVEECERGQEEISAPTHYSSDRVRRDCPAGAIDSDSDGSTATVSATSARRARTRLSLASQGVPCLPVTTCDAGEEETAESTPTSDRVRSQCELDATFKPVDGQAESCRPVTHECEFGTFQSQVPTLDSDREYAGVLRVPKRPLRDSRLLCAGGRAVRRLLSVPAKHIHPARLRLGERRVAPACNPSTEYERTACATSSPSATLASSACVRPPQPPMPSASRAPSAAPTTTATRSLPASRGPTATMCRRAPSAPASSSYARPAPPTWTATPAHTVHAVPGWRGLCRALWPAATSTTRKWCALPCAPPSSRTASTAAASRPCSTATATRTSARAHLLTVDAVPVKQCTSSFRRRWSTPASASACALVPGYGVRGVHHRHRRLPQRGLYALLFSRSVSGDVTVMGSTASPCEADAFLDNSNELKASDAVGSWTTMVLLGETSSNSKEVGTVLLVDHRQSSVAVCHAVFDDASLLLPLLNTNMHMSHHVTFYPSKRGQQKQNTALLKTTATSHGATCSAANQLNARWPAPTTTTTRPQASTSHHCVSGCCRAKKTHKAGQSMALLLLLLYLNASHQSFEQVPPVMPLPLVTDMVSSCIDDAVASQFAR
ncbi:hypothetical protein PTSG_13137 [Salpingoeca rosetta]|uniref:TNFR-Cys domain-containing protein n=1 Tax=Salpingoeca rosetta (strain ATCC 50818 / BSB-021) TaxID=946362 RepID=F2URZ9_SALR5|nr:uncharacterized protein PTSG_13137 [Salpingoeca rosetta]EGD80404.1 hypothetical protein PTSG_13137 [Salpingoeca rosetta]|eukprot:XP_004987968.1 hypothetical protein PTSG_13137 [Salpingoeca rosetta]